MSGKLVGQILKLKLTHAQREILLVMAESCRNCDGAGIDCGVRYVAWATDYSERQVQRIQRQLEVQGILEVQEAPHGKPIVWKIDVSRGELKPAFVPKQKRAGGDITVSPEAENGVTSSVTTHDVTSDTQMSPQKRAGGDMPSANLSRYHKDINKHQDINKRNNARANEPDFGNVPKQDRLEICRAWASSLSIAPIGAYSERNQHTAAEIFTEGYRATQVEMFVRAKMNDPWWIGKTLTLQKVAELMPQWLLDNDKPRRIVPEGVVNAGQKLIPVEWGVNEFAHQPLNTAVTHG